MPAGRPTKMTNETLKKLRDAFLMDCTDAEACHVAGITHQTLINHQKRHPSFLELKERWKNGPTYRARAKIVKAIRKDDDNTADAWKWITAKRRDEFGQQSTIHHTGQIEHNLGISRGAIDTALRDAGVIDVTPEKPMIECKSEENGENG